MPCILTLNGWKVYMYYDDHIPPHFHLISPDQSNDFRVLFDGELHSVKTGNAKYYDKKIVLAMLGKTGVFNGELCTNKAMLLINWSLATQMKRVHKLF